MSQTIFLSMGSNVGDRREHLRRGVHLLREIVRVMGVSSLYETAPVGVTDQSPFLNLAVQAETDLKPHDLLAAVKGIEQEEGRTPTFRWGPRVLDIDILLYGDLVLEEPDLVVPHREMTAREFVLAPLAEIAPDAVHPVMERTIEELLEAVRGTGDVRLFGPLDAPQ